MLIFALKHAQFILFYQVPLEITDTCRVDKKNLNRLFEKLA